MAKTEELKNCPFCGGEAEIIYILNLGNRRVRVKCKQCFASSAVFRENPDFCAKDKAIEAWNRRPEQNATDDGDAPDLLALLVGGEPLYYAKKPEETESIKSLNENIYRLLSMLKECGFLG